MVWKETLMAWTMDWGYGKTQDAKRTKFNCGFISRLNERCWLYSQDPEWLFMYLLWTFNGRFPRYFVWANF